MWSVKVSTYDEWIGSRYIYGLLKEKKEALSYACGIAVQIQNKYARKFFSCRGKLYKYMLNFCDAGVVADCYESLPY